MIRFLPLAVPASLALLTAGARAQSNLEMGKMWTFHNPPLAYLEEEYGFTPTGEWLNALRLASLRMTSGCSASFVSPQGLIMTNHHCARGAIESVQGEADYVKTGYYAQTLEQEIPVPDVAFQQLVRTEDVTAEVLRGIDDKTDDATTASLRKANIERIETMAKERFPDLKAQVVELFQGAMYQLYLYKEYTEVKLVLAPHLQSAYFGGDPDNFTYPRYCLDYTFFRAYEDGEPADTSAHYFPWSKEGPQENELTFVTGNPGRTNRLKTSAQLSFFADVRYPIIVGLIRGQLDVLRAAAGESPEAEKKYRNRIFSLSNSDKAYTGYLGGLLDPALMAAKRSAEWEFRSRIHGEPNLDLKYGDVWGRLEEIARERRDLEPKTRFYSAFVPSGPLARAVAVARGLVEEDSKPWREVSGSWSSPLHRAYSLNHLERMDEWLAEDDPLRRALGLAGNAPQVLAALEAAGMDSEDQVAGLLAGVGEIEQLHNHDNLALRAAHVIAVERAKVRDRARELTEMEEAQGARLGQALFAAYGTTVSPDATFTPRFSDGRVQGFDYNGTVAPWKTTYWGLYGRNADFDNTFPFDLPQEWLDAKGDIDMDVGLNFVSSNDIIGGNSGSPIVNKDLEVIGLIFDGNIEMLPNNFLYRKDVPRSVSVHVHGMLESMRKVYNAQRIANELSGHAK